MADHKLTEHYTTQLLTEDEDEKYQQKLKSPLLPGLCPLPALYRGHD